MHAPVTIYGAGSWGTALACLLARNGKPTLLWGRSAGAAERMRRSRSNERYLPGVEFPESLGVTSELGDSVGCVDFVLAVPTRAQREVARRVAALGSAQRVLCAAKGYEPSTQKRMSQVLTEEYSVHGGHVANVVIDGTIDSPGTRALPKIQEQPERAINPAKIADAFYYLHTQDRSCWSHELQLTPHVTMPSF